MKGYLYLFLIIILLQSYPVFAQWVEADSGLTGHIMIASIAFKDGKIFAGTWNDGVYVTTNNGLTWLPAGTEMRGEKATDIIVYQNKLVAADENMGYFTSSDNGNSWSFYHGEEFQSNSILAFLEYKNILYAGSVYGLYYTIDTCKSWQMPYGFKDITINCIFARNDTLFLGTYNNGVIIYDLKSGELFTRKKDIENEELLSIVVIGDRIFTSGIFGCYYSDDYGLHWQKSTKFTYAGINSMIVKNDLIYLSYDVNVNGTVFVSNDKGNNWASISNGLSKARIYVIAFNGDSIYGGGGGESTFWKAKLSELLPDNDVTSNAEDKQIGLYPNPAFDNLRISINNDDLGSSSIKIINELGLSMFETNELYNFNLNKNIINVSISNYPSGTYYILLNDGRRIVSKKFIKL